MTRHHTFDQSMQDPKQARTLHKIAGWCIPLIALLVSIAAISNQSLWIDEAQSASKAIQPSLSAWWATMVFEKGSDLQTPFYMLYLWSWEKVFGATEIALRAANIPWFVAAASALLWSFRRERRLRMSLFALILTSAFLWYYVNEARPYLVLYSFACITASCLFSLMADEASAQSSTWFYFFCVGLIGLCATSMIAVPWALGAILAAAYWLGFRQVRGLLSRFRYSASATAIALAALGFYYVWTLTSGARASAISNTNIANVVFIFYELAGLGGLGPGRLALRETGVGAIRHFIPMLTAGLLAVLALLSAATYVAAKKISQRRLIFFSIAILLPFSLVILAGIVARMRLLGRHFIPLLPFLLTFFAVGLESLLVDRRFVFKTIGAIAIVVFMVSALEIRFATRHARDDYRLAVSEGRRAILSGKTVWWTAEPSAAKYYHAPLNSKNFIVTSGMSEEQLAMAPAPDLVCFSKPDIYDQNAVVTHYLQKHAFKVVETFPAFQIFEQAEGDFKPASSL